MSDSIAPAAPFPAERTLSAPADPLGGDWSDGLRGPLRALGIPEPRLISLDGTPLPPPPLARPAFEPPAPAAGPVEARDAWASASEAALPSQAPAPQSQPPPPEPPSVIAEVTGAFRMPAFRPDVTPPSPAPAFQHDVTQPFAAPSFKPDLTPPSPAPDFQRDTPPSPAPSFQPDITPPSPAPSFHPDVTPPSPAPAFEPEARPPAAAEFNPE